MNVVSSLFSKVTNLLSPPYCFYCYDFLTERSVLCGRCEDRIRPLVSLTLPVTPTQKITVHAIGAYQEPLKSLILAKRFGNRVASKQLGELLWRCSVVSQIPCDALVPIPLHWTRYARRGYNQAEVMAQQIARRNGALIVPALTRVRVTAFQAGLVAKERRANVQLAFALTKDSELIRDKHVILVDDLITTGATLIEAAKIVLHAKPASITALVACRVA